MRVIHIDAEAKTVEEKEIDGELRTFQSLVGGYIQTATRLANGDVLLVDEEGLLKMKLHGFMIAGYPGHLIGNGVIVGSRGADFKDAKSDLERVRKSVAFGNTALRPS